MAWFDATPTGRLINRFSQDIATVDKDLMYSLNQFLDRLIGSSQVVLVVTVTLPVMLLCFLPVMVYFLIISNRYFKVSRDLKRLESVNKSPVFVLFSETVSGLSTIRAFSDQPRFFRLCCDYVDNMSRCNYYMWVSNRWLNIRTQFMGAVVSGGVAYFVVREAGYLGSTISGLALVYAIKFTEELTYLLRAHSECQINMNSLERIEEYCRIEQEKYEPDPHHHQHHGAHSTTTTSSFPVIRPASSIKEGLEFNKLAANHSSSSGNGYGNGNGCDRDHNGNSGSGGGGGGCVPLGWPSKGDVVFDRITMRYRPEAPPVLK
jgi:ABC-type multidrug transport system fused ATPase/permease subunit